MDQSYAVIFDMDGVLIDTYYPHFQSWLEMAKRHGLSFTEEEFAPTFGRTSREIIAHFWGEGHFTDEQMAEMTEEKEADYREMVAKDFPRMEGVGKLLEELKRAGFKMAIGSSGPPENVAMARNQLDPEGKYFESMVTAEDVQQGKPDPQVFLIAAERLGMSVGRCVVIEDAPPGIQAAHAAGMVAVGMVSTGRTRKELVEADLLVDHLEEVSAEKLQRLIDR